MKFISTRIAKDNIVDMKRFVNELPMDNDTLVFIENTDDRGTMYLNAKWEVPLKSEPKVMEYFGVVSIDGKEKFETKIKATPIIQGR